MPAQLQQPSQDVINAIVGDVKIDAAMAMEGTEQPKGPPTFDVSAYSGGKLSLPNFEHSVVVDLATLRFAENIMAHLDHNREKRTGHVTEKYNDGKTLGLSGVLSFSNQHSQEVVAASNSGFKWQASIEAVKDGGNVQKIPAGKQISVNGQTFKGPVYVARDWILTGFSFVPHGADATTHARIAAEAANLNPKEGTMTTTLENEQNVEVDRLEQVIEASKRDNERIDAIARLTDAALQSNPRRVTEIEAMSRLAVQDKWSAEKYELELLRANRPQAHTTSRSSKGAEGQVIEAALCMTVGVQNLEKHYKEEVLDAAHSQFKHGLGLSETLLITAQENGYRGRTIGGVEEALYYATDRSRINASGFSTVSLTNILSNVANKLLSDGYNHVDSEWKKICARASHKDFKQSTKVALTGDMRFEQVGKDGQLKHATVGEDVYTNQVKTYGKMFAITREHWINDDVGALAGVRNRLGRGAALGIARDFWTVFLNNSSFFTAGRNNYDEGSDTAFSAAALEAADLLFRTQTDSDGMPLGAMPKLLVVPPAHRIAALKLMSSQTVYKDSNEGGDNPWAGAFEVVSSPYMISSSLTGNSATAFYLLADPLDIPVVEVAYLNGKDTPTVESAEADFNQLGIQFRGWFDYGFNLQDYRGGVKLKGAA